MYMRHSLKAILIALVVFNVALAGTVTAKVCGKPCCSHAKKDDCKDGAPAGISAARLPCCDVKPGGDLPDAASVANIAFPGGKAVQHSVSVGAYVHTILETSPERLRPGPLLKFSFTPIYTLTSSYLC